MVELGLKNQVVKIDAGELVSYTVNGIEYMHQKGSPGWRNTDTEMFPVIGPTAAADFKVQTPRGIAVQDQHGVLREMAYTTENKTENTVIFKKQYPAGRKFKNSKYPEKSTAEELYWPYDFTFKKVFRLKESGLEITFTIAAEQGMPFMLGYHPAFKIHTKTPVIIANSKEIHLKEVLDAGSRALEVEQCNMVILKDKKSLQIKTKGFGRFMLWTEVPNMICIEPITFYPYTVSSKELHNGFMNINKKEHSFEIFISVIE